MATAAKKTATAVDSVSEQDAKRKAFGARRAQWFKTLGLGDHNIRTKESDFKPTRTVSCGIPEINEMIGDVVGFPDGSLIELCGDYASGKTYLALKTIAEACKEGFRCSFLNVENSFFAGRARAIGVPVGNEDLFEVIDNIEYAETWGELLKMMVESGEYRVIVVDSISALEPKDDFGKTLEQSTRVGEQARFTKRLTRKLMGLCARTGTICILINQFYMGQASHPSMGMVKEAAGGRAMGYFTHIRLWLTRIMGAAGEILGSEIDAKTKKPKVIGGKSRCLLQKNRFGPANKTCDLPIMFEASAVNPLAEFLARASAKKFLTVYRKEYRYVDETTGEILCADKNPFVFFRALQTAPPPSKKVRGDQSENGFEWVCGRIKLTEAQVEALVQFVSDAESLEELPEINAPNDTRDVLFSGDDSFLGDDDDEELTGDDS